MSGHNNDLVSGQPFNHLANLVFLVWVETIRRLIQN